MKFLKKIFNPVRWHYLRSVKPLSKVFGLDRGTPVDRYYIEKFLSKNASFITGRVLEIGDNDYTRKFGSGEIKSEVLHYTKDNPQATIVGDLTNPDSLPHDLIDCFICTQTFNFIYDFKKAIAGAHQVLKPGGVLLVTLAGLSQISRYDMDRWGDFWRFTNLSASRAFTEVFGDDVTVSHFGNVLSSISLLHGISVEELDKEELDVNDPDYQMVITVVARKRGLEISS
jgi:SAM-dependent methyltransferase